MRTKLGILIFLSIIFTVNSESILKFSATEFTEFNQNVTSPYASSTYYRSKGMSPLYDVTNYILDIVVGKDLIPPGYLTLAEQEIKAGPKIEKGEWGDLLKTYWGILLIVLITGLIVVLMPIIGFCFCCCRCTGGCGGRTQPFDKKHDGCRRGFWGLLLITATSLLIFGVVASFVTNAYLQQGIENFTFTAEVGTNDTRIFFDSTSTEINHLLVTNYDELMNNLNSVLDDTSEIVIKRFENESRVISLVELNVFVNSLPKVKEDLARMAFLTKDLRVKASQLNDGLRGVKRELLVSLTKCVARECSEFLEKYQIGKLDVNGIDYNQLPDEKISLIFTDVDTLLNEDIGQSVSEGELVLDNIKSSMESDINRNVIVVRNALQDAGKEIKEVSHDITNQFTRLSNIIGNNSYQNYETTDKYIRDYGVYRFWFGLGISCILLLIVFCLILGLLCGICGRRPSGYGDDCCNKGAGSNCLMIAVAFIFLTISALTIVCFTHFIVGFVAKRVICDPLRAPENHKVFTDFIDVVVDLNEYMYSRNPSSSTSKLYNRANTPLKRKNADSLEQFKISDVIIDCHQNKSIYQVLRLKNYIDVQDILKYLVDYEIGNKITELINSIKVDNNVNLFSTGIEESITRLIDSELSTFDADQFTSNLADNVTDHNLTELSQRLVETSNNIVDDPKFYEIKTSLRTQALHLETYQDKLVTPMTNAAQEMIVLATELDTKLKNGHPSFQKAMETILDEIQFAEKFINTNGTASARQVADELLNNFENEIKSYLTLIVASIETKVGHCEPLARVYDAMLVASCNSIVDPWNGFWAGLGWCIGIFLLTIIFCAKLSTLYQKSDPYPGPIVEAEYLYDAYSERDNIPLANAPKNKRRKKYERRRNSREPRDYYDDSSSSHTGHPMNGGPPREARYNDMAPKHWEGGPPRYHSPPIAPPDPEYERPPPYYYPGTPAQEN